MSKNTRWPLRAFQDKGLVEVDGKFVPIVSVTSFGKVNKLSELVGDNKKTLGVVGADLLPSVKIDTMSTNLFGTPLLHACTTVKIVPLTVNRAWQGRRFKTDRYKQYALAVSLMLPDNIIVPDGLFKVYYEFGMGVTSDWDNPCKPLQDILQAKYGFNDRNIMEAHVKKVVVKKGEEYIKFRFEKL